MTVVLYLILKLADLLFQVLLCPQMYCPLGKVLQSLIKVTDLIQGLAAWMKTLSLMLTECLGHCHLSTGLVKIQTYCSQKLQAGLFYHCYCSVSEDVLYSILSTCHLCEDFHKIRSQWSKA